MMKLAVILILIALVGQYELSFNSEASVREISLCVGAYVYAAYTPPDESATVVVMLTPELEEVASIHVDGLVSPCIKTYNDVVYLAGIRGESVVVQAFSETLEAMNTFEFTVEEPTRVYIYPYEEGILLAYVHRFLEDMMLHQDVFLRKYDFSFTQIAEARVTDYDFWEDPSITVYNGNIFMAYGNAPLIPLGEYVVVTKFSPSLERLGDVKYPQTVKEVEGYVEKSANHPELVQYNGSLLLLCRVADHAFAYQKFTQQGFATFIPGNIVGIEVGDDLSVKEEFFITEDRNEHYQPELVMGFGKVYCAQYLKEEKEAGKLSVVCSDSLEGVRALMKPAERSYWWIVPVVVAIVAAGAVVWWRAGRKQKKVRKK